MEKRRPRDKVDGQNRIINTGIWRSGGVTYPKMTRTEEDRKTGSWTPHEGRSLHSVPLTTRLLSPESQRQQSQAMTDQNL